MSSSSGIKFIINWPFVPTASRMASRQSPTSCSLPRDMAVDPLHRIGRIERKYTREHLVEGDAPGGKDRSENRSTDSCDRCVRAPCGRVFRHHLRSSWVLALAWQTGSNAKTRKPDRTSACASRTAKDKP